MTITNPDDISVVLSGGSINVQPNKSIGGAPSSTPIVSGNLNNLFHDISAEESESGHEDYRCIYVFNDGETPLYNLKLWILEDASSANMEIGIDTRDEVQQIAISNGTPTGGSFVLSYDSHSIMSNFESDLGSWASSLQYSLRSLADSEGNALLPDVTVTAQSTGSSIVFEIRFVSKSGKRSHPELVVDSNFLTPGGTSITVSTIQQGSPINTEAPSLNSETTPPGGVSFFTPSQSSPINLLRLSPEDGFPLWIKRVVPADSSAVENDSFKIRLRAGSLSG